MEAKLALYQLGAPCSSCGGLGSLGFGYDPKYKGGFNSNDNYKPDLNKKYLLFHQKQIELLN